MCLGINCLSWVSFCMPMGYSFLSAVFQYGGKEVLERAIPAMLERHLAAQVSDGAEGIPGRFW